MIYSYNVIFGIGGCSGCGTPAPTDYWTFDYKALTYFFGFGFVHPINNYFCLVIYYSYNDFYF